jgi:hypothetical protein
MGVVVAIDVAVDIHGVVVELHGVVELMCVVNTRGDVGELHNGVVDLDGVDASISGVGELRVGVGHHLVDAVGMTVADVPLYKLLSQLFLLLSLITLRQSGMKRTRLSPQQLLLQ